MRYLRIGGIVLSLCVLLCGMALQSDSVVRASLICNLGAMALCFLEKPAQRASLFAPAACFLCAALALLSVQTGDPYLTVSGLSGEKIVPAGESAYRTVAACLFAVLVGASIGETALEGMLGKGAFGSRAGWSGAPVRVCALLCLLAGMGACLAPGLNEYIIVPPAVLNVTAMFAPLATGAVLCYAASARSKTAACLVLLLYLASAVFDPPLFARHAFFALAVSVFLCAKGNSGGSLLCLLPIPSVLALLWFYRADASAAGLYAGRLWQSVQDLAQPGGLDWILQIYARFDIWGCAGAGVGAGALLFLLGRLLRDSFLYAAPVLFALVWGCMMLFRGVGAMPALGDIVFFLVPYGLCLIVGCMRRTAAKRRK